MIGTQDMSYEFNIMEKYPTFYYKELDKDKLHNKTINAEFKIKAQSKLTRLIAPFYDDEAKKNSSYEVQYSQDYNHRILLLHLPSLHHQTKALHHNPHHMNHLHPSL